MSDFSLAAFLDYDADALFESAPSAEAWLPIGCAELIRGDAKVIAQATRRLWQAELEPRVNIKQSAVKNGAKSYLVLQPEIVIDHFAADADPSLRRAADVYFGVFQILYQLESFEAWLDELSLADQIDDDKLLLLKEITTQWRNANCDSSGEFDPEKQLPSPARQAEKANFEALCKQYNEVAGFCVQQKFKGGGLSASTTQYRLEIPEPIAQGLDAPDENASGDAHDQAQPKRKSRLFRSWQHWLSALFYLVFGSATLAGVAFVAWLGWHGFMKFHPKGDDRQLVMVSEIYNGQQLYINDRARELVMQSPGVFADYIEALITLTQNNEDLGPYQQLIGAIDNYSDAWRFRRDLYEHALMSAADMQFDIQPVQEIAFDQAETPVSIVLDHLDMRQDPKQEVIRALREHWQSAQAVIERIHSLQAEIDQRG